MVTPAKIKATMKSRSFLKYAFLTWTSFNKRSTPGYPLNSTFGLLGSESVDVGLLEGLAAVEQHVGIGRLNKAVLDLSDC